MSYVIRRTIATLCSFTTTLGIASVASAQEQPAGEGAVVSAKLEEVIVTAERHLSNVQNTPTAITVIDGSELREQAKSSAATILSDMPSVSVQSTPQGGQVFIRGIGANGDSNAVDPAVSLMIDNVYSGLAEEVFGTLYDIERIEVLRGPQGTLYGRNATGGAVNVLTKNPVDRYEATFNGEVASADRYRADGAVNIPFGQTLALRLASVYETGSQHYSNNDAGDFRQIGARGKLLWTPNEDLSVLTFASYAHKYGLTAVTTAVPHPLTEGPPSFQWDSRPNDPWYIDSFHIPNRDDERYMTVGAQIDYNLGWATLTVIPSYRHNKRYAFGNLITGTFPTGAPLNVAQNSVEREETQYTGEVRLASSGSSSLKWVTGLYGLHGNNAPTSGRVTTGGVFADIAGTDRPVESLAAFGQLTYSVAENTRLTGGLRYTHDKKGVDWHYVSLAIPGYDGGRQEASASFSAVTYKVGIEQDLAPESLFYAQVASGYKAGGFGLDLPPTEYKPEHLTAFEIGSKNRFLDSTLQLNGEIYLYKYRDAQVQAAIYQPYALPAQYIPPSALIPQFLGGTCGGTPPLCSFGQPDLNAASATNYGGELEMRYLFTPHDQLDISVAYTHARYGDLVLPQQLLGAGGPPGATVTTYTDASGALVLSDTQIAHAPEWSGSLGYKHIWEIGSGQLSASAYSKFSSSYWATVNKQFYGAKQDSYHRSDAYLTYSAGREKQWSVTAYVKNIEDDAQKTFIFPLYRQMITAPRTYGVVLSIGL